MLYFVHLAKANEHEQRLVRDLMRSYDIRIRPYRNIVEPLNVTFGLALGQIIDLVRFSHNCYIYILTIVMYLDLFQLFYENIQIYALINPNYALMMNQSMSTIFITK